MFNCKSNEERHQWIARIRTAIPNAVIPKAERKESESKQEETAPTTQKEEKKEPESTEDISITPPLTTHRQDTVDEAALLAGSTQHDGKSTCCNTMNIVDRNMFKGCNHIMLCHVC